MIVKSINIFKEKARFLKQIPTLIKNKYKVIKKYNK